MTIAMRYAEGDEDIVTIHRFLCTTALSAALCPINLRKSLNEVIHVVRESVALMAFVDEQFAGTLGLIMPDWWYGDGKFMADRWFFVAPGMENTGVGAALLGEAAAIAFSTGVPLIIHGRMHRRAKAAGNGIHFMRPVTIFPGEQVDLQRAERQALHS